MSEIDITGLDKAELLAALYNHASPLGMGHLQARTSDMTRDEAVELLASRVSGNGTVRFDYVHGRPLKVWFEGDRLTGVRLYDRDNGYGACERIVNELRSSRTSGTGEERSGA